jgi:CHRD domain
VTLQTRIGGLLSSTVVMRSTVSFFLVIAMRLLAQPAQHAIVEWYADLSAARASTVGARAAIVPTSATGRVTVEVDFPRRTVTFHVDTKNLSGVNKIELHTYSAPNLLRKQAIYTVYDSSEGSFSGSMVKSVTGAAFDQVATPIVNSLAAIVVTTVRNPDGEIAGKIVMHKRHAM